MHGRQAVQFISPVSGVPGLFASPEGGYFTTKMRPNPNPDPVTTWPKSLESSVTPQPYNLGTSHLLDTGASQYTPYTYQNLESPTPPSNMSLNIPLASRSYDTTSHQPVDDPAPITAMQSPVSAASVPITSSSGSQVNTVFSHARSSNSYSSYSVNPEPIPRSSFLDPVPELAEVQPAQDDPETASVGSHAKQHRKRWSIQEDELLIAFWVGEKQSSERLVVALSSPRSPKSGTLLAPEWTTVCSIPTICYCQTKSTTTQLWKDVFAKSRELPPIVVHWWTLVDICLDMLKLVSYIGEDPSNDNPFISHESQLDQLLDLAQTAKAIGSKLTAETIRLWIQEGWYVRLRNA